MGVSPVDGWAASSVRRNANHPGSCRPQPWRAQTRMEQTRMRKRSPRPTAFARSGSGRRAGAPWPPVDVQVVARDAGRGRRAHRPPVGLPPCPGSTPRRTRSTPPAPRDTSRNPRGGHDPRHRLRTLLRDRLVSVPGCLASLCRATDQLQDGARCISLGICRLQRPVVCRRVPVVCRPTPFPSGWSCRDGVVGAVARIVWSCDMQE